MTEPDHPRGNALRGRSLAVVTGILSLVRDAALDRALDPRNVAKGSWHDLSRGELFDLLEDEIRELRASVYEGEPLDRILSEAGDVVWCVAMIVDAEVSRAR